MHPTWTRCKKLTIENARHVATGLATGHKRWQGRGPEAAKTEVFARGSLQWRIGGGGGGDGRLLLSAAAKAGGRRWRSLSKALLQVAAARLRTLHRGCLPTTGRGVEQAEVCKAGVQLRARKRPAPHARNRLTIHRVAAACAGGVGFGRAEGRPCTWKVQTASDKSNLGFLFRAMVKHLNH